MSVSLTLPFKKLPQGLLFLELLLNIVNYKSRLLSFPRQFWLQLPIVILHLLEFLLNAEVWVDLLWDLFFKFENNSSELFYFLTLYRLNFDKLPISFFKELIHFIFTRQIVLFNLLHFSFHSFLCPLVVVYNIYLFL